MAFDLLELFQLISDEFRGIFQTGMMSDKLLFNRNYRVEILRRKIMINIKIVPKHPPFTIASLNPIDY